jgi:hypothetical protein
MGESLSNPYGPSGRVALALMKLILHPLACMTAEQANRLLTLKSRSEIPHDSKKLGSSLHPAGTCDLYPMAYEPQDRTLANYVRPTTLPIIASA